MGDAPLMLGVSGLRGIVGESLTLDLAVRYAQAFGGWVVDTYGDRSAVALAADGRAGYEPLKQAVISGLLGSGLDVYDAGVQMTPTAGLAGQSLLHTSLGGKHVVAAGIITASHNPQEWNGIKWLISDQPEIPEYKGDGDPSIDEIMRMAVESTREKMKEGTWNSFYAPSASTAGEIIDSYRKGASVKPLRESRVIAVDNLADSHIQQVSAGLRKIARLGLVNGNNCSGDLQTAIRELLVVVDSVNCSGGRITELFAKDAGFRLVQLHGDNSGIFPHTPEPTEENLSGEGGLCDAVPGLKADVGFAQDPDGDRLAIVDEKGGYIGEEYTLVLCAVSVLEAMKHQTPSDRSAATSPVGDGGGEGVVLCANLSTSRMIDDVAARYGASVVRTAVGEANVVEAMKKLKKQGKKVLLGGEGNGGVIWPEVTYVRDSLSSMALVLSLMARTGKTVSELVADVPSYAIVKRKQPLAKKEDARPAIERLAAHYKSERVDTQDGVRVDFDSDRSWVHVRASNTEPILRLIAEAPTQERAEAVLDEVQGLVDAG
ncbi:MAG: phosphoglucosamine mutase [Phycisphaerales bacterium]